jgi:Fe-S-cluster containining protein
MNDERAIARAALADAGEPRRLPHAVVRFHRHVDDILARSHAAHGTQVACRRGCSLCCSLQVEVLPPEAFALAQSLKARLAPKALEAVRAKLRANMERIAAIGLEVRKRTNLRCALLGADGACTAYESRPAQCRRFHSTRLATCEASYADPADDAIESPAHPAVAHNAQVIVTLAQHGLRDAGLDATPVDMNFALCAALDDAKAWRRWRDGKKPFVTATEPEPALEAPATSR